MTVLVSRALYTVKVTITKRVGRDTRSVIKIEIQFLVGDFPSGNLCRKCACVCMCELTLQMHSTRGSDVTEVLAERLVWCVRVVWVGVCE